MTTRLITLISLNLLAIEGIAQAQAFHKNDASQKNINRKSLFIGAGNEKWMPATTLLPSAEELESVAQKLSSRLRNVDPFGLSTFPREEDVKAKPAVASALRSTPKPTLNQALKTLKITGICLNQREFLIGGRNVFEGDVMHLEFQNEIFLAQVVEVGPTQIRFRDLERKDTGVLSHSLLPQLRIEPIENRSQMNGLEDKLSPMETQSPIRQQ
jgi:hypothetical protein